MENQKSMKNCWMILCLLSLSLAPFHTLHAAEVVTQAEPCRVMDTRTWSAGAMSANTTRTFSLDPDEADSQGGTEGCGISETAIGATLLVHAAPTTANGGILKVYDAAINPTQTFASTTFTSANQYQTVQINVPLMGSHIVGIWAQVASNVVVDIVGAVEPCIPEDVWELAYSSLPPSSSLSGQAWAGSSIYVPSTSDTDLGKYGPEGRKIWLGGAASQPGLYTITQISPDRKRLYVYPQVQSATDEGLEVHILSGDCSPRETALDGFNG